MPTPFEPSQIRFLIFRLILFLWAVPGLLFGMTADELTSKTSIAGGLCAFPQATQDDVKLALELAKRPTFIVHVMAKTEADVASFRAAADAAGVLGRSFYVEKGSVAKLPFADHLVDLLVISNLSEADLTQEARAECLRVIEPVRGLALVGSNGTAAARLSKEKFGAWAGNLPMTKVQEDASGAWAWLRASLPAGADAWTHRLHGPESNQTSMDTALQAPFLTQWWGLPRNEGFWGSTMVACNGRLFSISSCLRREQTTDHALLTARSMYSGVVLWQQELREVDKGAKVRDGGWMAWRSFAVATKDSLFLTDRDGIRQLNAETGADRNRIAGPKKGGQVKWFAVENNLLAMMAGEQDRLLVSNNAYSNVAENPIGRDMAVYDMETGKMLWSKTATGDIDERLIVMSGQRIYYLAQGVGLVCQDAKNGQVLWTNASPDVQSNFNAAAMNLVRNGMGSLCASTLSAYKDVLLLRGREIQMVFSRQNGNFIWKKALKEGMYNHSCAWGDIWLNMGKPLNLLTGAETAGPVFARSGCGVTFSTPNYLITCFARVTEAKSNRLIRIEDMKSPCDIGTIVSDGLLISYPSACGCNFELKGYRVLASAGDIKPHTAPPWKDRLTLFDNTEPAPMNISAADWPTYRHDPQRSAGSAATVGEQAKKILWQWKPCGMEPYSKPSVFEGGLKPDFLATASVATEGLVWFGSHDGVVHCVKADTGAEVWSFATKGMLFKPPTLWQGRLLVGSGDGCVYSLDARTGKCLWRLQAAPLDRRVFWYGHLINTWPVLPGVVVQDDVAYTLAGYQKENGVHAYAFSPKTGQVLWERDDVGANPPDLLQTEKWRFAKYGLNQPSFFGHNRGGLVVRFNKNDQEWTGLSSHGGMALGAGKLWLAGGCYVSSLDLKNGESKGYGAKFGSEVGVFDKWILQGGHRISELEDTFNQSGFQTLSEITISTVSSNEEGVTGITLNDLGTSLPAWDPEHILLPPSNKLGGSLSLVPRTKFTTWLTAYPSTPASFDKIVPEHDKPKPDFWKELQQWNTDGVKGLLPIAFALAKDQAVVAYSDGTSHKLCGYLRATGKKAWTVDLPEQPAMNRLALDRNGRVLVSLCDGSVVCVGQ